MADEKYDVVVIGGGPAGLACALWVARYRLSVLLIDREDPRNEATVGVHGYLGLQHIPPMKLRELGRAQAIDAGALIEEGTVEAVFGAIDDFHVKILDGRTVRARRVVFGTGLRDIIPEIPGLDACFGKSIWHCSTCDGPSVVGRRVGVIGRGKPIVAFCMEMLTWTDQLVILTHGQPANVPEDAAAALERFQIAVIDKPIRAIEGKDGQVQAARFADGSSEPFEAMFFHIATGPGCSIPAKLGCKANEEGILEVDSDFATTVPGVYAAGDITAGSKLAIRAAADGTRAAIGVFGSLIPPERKL